ncbi:hypothetical protein TNCV_161051 [Trichonephila clavipes]|nr:hypothetical protein TNCV_161051 [Trichonephila clavipes]
MALSDSLPQINLGVQGGTQGSLNTVTNVAPAPFDVVGDQKRMMMLPEEVGEKGFLESRSPTFRIDSSRKDMRMTGFRGSDWRQKRALELKDLMITDQLQKKAAIEFKEHHLDEWSGIISPVDLARKIKEYEDVRKTFPKKSYMVIFRGHDEKVE